MYTTITINGNTLNLTINGNTLSFTVTAENDANTVLVAEMCNKGLITEAQLDELFKDLPLVTEDGYLEGDGRRYKTSYNEEDGYTY